MERMPCHITDERVFAPDFDELERRDDYDADRADDLIPDDLIMKRYWVEMLLDDGEAWGGPADAHDYAGAEIEAIQDARCNGLRPVEVVSVTLM